MFAVAAFSFSNAQGLEIIGQNGNHSLNDSTVMYWGNPTNEMVSILWVINTGATADTVKVKRYYISVLGNTTNAICWAGLCYDSTHNFSDLTYIIGPGDTAKLANQFNGDYYPNGQIGTSRIQYTFFDIGRPSTISDTVYVDYITTPTGIPTETAKAINFSAPYPNPSNSTVNFSYSLASGVSTASMKIFNLLGECIQTLPLNTNKTKTALNVQSIPSGIYVCEIEANGCKPAYQKMIVSH